MNEPELTLRDEEFERIYDRIMAAQPVRRKRRRTLLLAAALLMLFVTAVAAFGLTRRTDDISVTEAGVTIRLTQLDADETGIYFAFTATPAGGGSFFSRSAVLDAPRAVRFGEVESDVFERTASQTARGLGASSSGSPPTRLDYRVFYELPADAPRTDTTVRFTFRDLVRIYDGGDSPLGRLRHEWTLEIPIRFGHGADRPT